jgi:hypothetical protein
MRINMHADDTDLTDLHGFILSVIIRSIRVICVPIDVLHADLMARG